MNDIFSYKHRFLLHEIGKVVSKQEDKNRYERSEKIAVWCRAYYKENFKEKYEYEVWTFEGPIFCFNDDTFALVFKLTWL